MEKNNSTRKLIKETINFLIKEIPDPEFQSKKLKEGINSVLIRLSEGGELITIRFSGLGDFEKEARENFEEILIRVLGVGVSQEIPTLKIGENFYYFRFDYSKRLFVLEKK